MAENIHPHTLLCFNRKVKTHAQTWTGVAAVKSSWGSHEIWWNYGAVLKCKLHAAGNKCTPPGEDHKESRREGAGSSLTLKQSSGRCGGGGSGRGPFALHLPWNPATHVLFSTHASNCSRQSEVFSLSVFSFSPVLTLKGRFQTFCFEKSVPYSSSVTPKKLCQVFSSLRK